MQSSKNEYLKHEQNLYDQIVQYNATVSEKDKIKFIHGGTCQPFTFMDQTVKLSNSDAKTTVPSALIPTGQLRKNYNIYPIVGELAQGAFGHEGKRRGAINYDAISGVKASTKGLEIAGYYANFGERIATKEHFFYRMRDLILKMDESNYVSYLKQIEMLAQNYALLGGKDISAQMSKWLEAEKLNLLKSNNISSLEHEKINKYFNKYQQRILNKLNKEDLPFKTNDNFIKEVSLQYPVIFCCAVEGSNFGDLPEEQIYKGPISLENIKLLFTHEKNIPDLQEKLKRLGYAEKIKILPLPQPDKIMEYTHLPDSITSLKNTIPTIKNNNSRQELRLQKDAIKSLLDQYCENYFEKGDENALVLMEYILKNYPIPANTEPLFNKRINELAFFNIKIQKDQHYLIKLDALHLQEKFPRLKKAEYLLTLCKIKHKLPNVQTFFDYSQTSDKTNLNQMLASISSEQERYRTLQLLYLVMLQDKERLNDSGKINNLESKTKIILEVAYNMIQKSTDLLTSDQSPLNEAVKNMIKQDEKKPLKSALKNPNANTKNKHVRWMDNSLATKATETELVAQMRDELNKLLKSINSHEDKLNLMTRESIKHVDKQSLKNEIKALIITIQKSIKSEEGSKELQEKQSQLLTLLANLHEQSNQVQFFGKSKTAQAIEIIFNEIGNNKSISLPPLEQKKQTNLFNFFRGSFRNPSNLSPDNKNENEKKNKLGSK